MSMMAANRLRRHRKRTDSIITVEAHGQGLLCFAPDGAWFQGQLEAADGRDFDLSGRLVVEEPPPPPTPESRESEDKEEHLPILLEGGSDDSGRPDSPPGRVSPEPEVSRRSSTTSSPGSVITPHTFEAAMRALVRVQPGAHVAYDVGIHDREEGSEHRVRFVAGGLRGEACSLDSREVQFTAERRYRGQKADMMIQRRLGPALLGRGCTVYTGRMRIEYQFDYMQTPKWCL